MNKKPFVYIAGPIESSGHVALNVRNAILVAEDLYKHGIMGFVPHLSVVWNMVTPDCTYKRWLGYDFQIILRCDALLRLPGKSDGADKEVKFARKNNVPVYYSMKEMVEALNDY